MHRLLVWLGIREQRVENILSDFHAAIDRLTAHAKHAEESAVSKRYRIAMEQEAHDADIASLTKAHEQVVAKESFRARDYDRQAEKARTVASKLAAIVA